MGGESCADAQSGQAQGIRNGNGTSGIFTHCWQSCRRPAASGARRAPDSASALSEMRHAKPSTARCAAFSADAVEAASSAAPPRALPAVGCQHLADFAACGHPPRRHRRQETVGMLAAVQPASAGRQQADRRPRAILPRRHRSRAPRPPRSSRVCRAMCGNFTRACRRDGEDVQVSWPCAMPSAWLGIVRIVGPAAPGQPQACLRQAVRLGRSLQLRGRHRRFAIRRADTGSSSGKC